MHSWWHIHVWQSSAFYRQMTSDYGPWPFIAGVSMIMWSLHKIWKAKGVHWWRKLTGVNLPITARYMLAPPKEIGQVFFRKAQCKIAFTSRLGLILPSRFQQLLSMLVIDLSVHNTPLGFNLRSRYTILWHFCVHIMNVLTQHARECVVTTGRNLVPKELRKQKASVVCAHSCWMYLKVRYAHKVI